MQALFEKYGLPYITGSLPRQVASAWKKVIRLSLPNDFGSKAQAKVLELGRPARGRKPPPPPPAAAPAAVTRGYGRSTGACAL